MSGHPVKGLDFGRDRSRLASHRRRTRFQVLGDHGLALSPASSEPVIIQRMTLEEKAEIVVTPQLDLWVLGDSRDQGGRRHPRFRDAVALLRDREFEDWPHSAVGPRKSFSRASVTGLATHTN